MIDADPGLLRGVLESIDRADPTRSHEAKPSVRMFNARVARRQHRAIAALMAAMFAAVVLAAASASSYL